jgi:hypothetical protein
MIVTSVERLPSLRTSQSAICLHRSAIYKARGSETSGSKEVKEPAVASLTLCLRNYIQVDSKGILILHPKNAVNAFFVSSVVVVSLSERSISKYLLCREKHGGMY